MTTTVERPDEGVAPEPARHSGATGILRWVTTTDHKRIGLSYIWTAIGFFCVGGLLALAIRTQLAQPDETLVDPQTYNEFFTMHGSIMIYLFAVPFAFGLANYIVPLQIGAPDMAFPKLNALGYWLYLFGGLTMISGFITASGAASFGWFAYAPLSGAVYSPGVGPDLWIIGVIVTSTAGVMTAVNLVTTIFMLRAPGMTMFRMPIYTWNMLVTSALVLLAFPVLTAALVMLFADRHLGTKVFEATKDGTPILWQHMFWFFGHPEVYIIALPFFGVVTEVFAVFSRRPVFGYKGLVFATLTIGGLSFGVWAHHMYATGAVLLPFFTIMSLLIAVPTGVKFFNWIGTMWGGRILFKTPMLFAIGMLLVFLIGGLSGVLQALAPVDFNLHDTYFVVAHMHYVIMGLVMGAFAGTYYWFPKMTGKMLSELWGKVHFFAFFIGINVTFFVQHQLGLDGMPRRVATYTEKEGWGTLNLVSTIGSYILAIGVLAFVINLLYSLRRGRPAGDDPWGGQTLEWATTSPPPEHNFDSLPPIRSERPLWDLNYPDNRAPRHVGRRARRVALAQEAGHPAASAADGADRADGADPEGTGP